MKVITLGSIVAQLDRIEEGIKHQEKLEEILIKFLEKAILIQKDAGTEVTGKDCSELIERSMTK